jgi:RecA-family ATPase
MTERSPSIQAEEIILPRFTARPWKWRDPKSISPRQWLHANHYIRKFASATIAPGGVGKTSQALVEAIGMACGRNFLGGQVAARPLAVWYWNLEDPPEEIDRRIAAILLHYNLDQTEIEGQLFINSTSDDDQLIIAVKQRDELVICHPVADALKAEMRMRAIDVMIIDPFVSCHRANENDSAAIDAVAKTWATIARNVSASVDLVHHVRKPSGASSEYTVDDARGAGSLIGAVRSTRVLNRMSKEEAEKSGIPLDERRHYFRVDKGEKDNMRPPAEKAEWRKLVSVPLNNQTEEDPGDWVGVVTAWKMPSAFDGLTAADLLRVQQRIAQDEWRENAQSDTWAGIAVAEVLDLDLSNAKSQSQHQDYPENLD